MALLLACMTIEGMRTLVNNVINPFYPKRSSAHSLFWPSNEITHVSPSGAEIRYQ